MSDTGWTFMGHPLKRTAGQYFLTFPGHLTSQQAEEIKQRFMHSVGRAPVILTGGLDVAYFDEGGGPTPIYDALVAEMGLPA